MSDKKVIVGGTFDCLHRGHREMLKEAMNLGDCIIGITSDSMANENREREVSKYEERAASVERFCEKLRKETGSEFEIREIESPDGDMVYKESVKYIVVSPEDKTVQRVNRINDRRYEKGINPLKIKVVNPIYADDGKRISSTRISQSIIDEEGNLMKGTLGIDIINDIHYGFYNDEKKNSKILEKLESLLQGRETKRTFVLGDVIHEENKEVDRKRFERVWDIIERETEDSYFLPGNHDVINLDMTYIQDIVGHKLPKRIEVNGKNILLVDSASASENKNIGKIDDDSIELLNNLSEDTYIMSHFPLEYTGEYRNSKFFDNYPETVFPINKYKLDLDYEKIEREIFAHLHRAHSYDKNGVQCDILPPFLNITSVEPKKGKVTNSIKDY